jgi:hypothetical protein
MKNRYTFEAKPTKSPSLLLPPASRILIFTKSEGLYVYSSSFTEDAALAPPLDPLIGHVMVANAGLFVALAHDLEDADSIAHHRTVHRLPRPKSFARLSGNAVHVRQHLIPNAVQPAAHDSAHTQASHSRYYANSQRSLGIPPTRDAPPRCQLSPSLAPSAVAMGWASHSKKYQLLIQFFGHVQNESER